MMLIHVGSKGRVSSLYVSLNCFERHLLCEPIHLICRVRRRPIHGLLERIHRHSGQLDVTFARLTVLQLLDVARLQSETVEIGKLGRIAELSDCEIAGKLAKRIDVGSKLEIFFGGRLHIHGAEYKHLIRRARFHYFCNRLPVANRCNLIIFQPNMVAKELNGSTFCALEAGRWTKESKSRARNNLGNRILTSIVLGIPFIFISCPTRGKQATTEDRGWKQKATALQKRWTFEKQSVHCSRERCPQEQARLQDRQSQTHLELQGWGPLRKGPRMEVRV